jgi:hypothetical protein
MIGEEYFSFAWIPIEQQIFFGRPSPELALKMLRDHGVAPLRAPTTTEPANVNDHPDVQKEYAMRCLEKTDEVLEDTFEINQADAMLLGCIWMNSDSDECHFE